MGNSNVKGTKTLYIAAMANVTSIERKELNGMRAKFGEAAKTGGGNPNTARKPRGTSCIVCGASCCWRELFVSRPMFARSWTTTTSSTPLEDKTPS